MSRRSDFTHPDEAARARHGATMRRLATALEAIAVPLPPGTPIAYLDYALHFNVGDLLINLGSEVFFERMGYDVKLRMSLFDLCRIDWERPQEATLKPSALRRLKELPPKVALVLHGGGNFGDLYPEFQALREQVVAHCPERRIVMLPQSLHFDDLAAQQRSLDRLLAHRDLHVFLRDVESLQAVQAHGSGHGKLLPDMAHALWQSEGWRPPAVPLNAPRLCLRRRDGEVRSVPPEGTHSVDWPDLVGAFDQFAFRAVRRTMHLDLDRRQRVAGRAWYAVRDRVVGRARRLFAAHGDVVTDRLHGMILAALLQRPVRYIDNSYGKLSRYARAWLDGSPLVAPAPAALVEAELSPDAAAPVLGEAVR